MRVFAATAFLLAFMITTIQAGGGGKEDDSKCPCLMSIELPKLESQFIVSR